MTDRPANPNNQPDAVPPAQRPPRRRRPLWRRPWLVALAGLVLIVAGLVLHYRSPAARVHRLLDELRPPGRVEKLFVRIGIARTQPVPGPADVRRAAQKLAVLGPDAVPALIRALGDDTEDVAQSATEALGMVDPPAVAALAEALKDPDADVRRRAAEALSSIGPAAAAVVPALIEALEDSNPGVVRAAAHALGAMGPEAEPAVPSLLRAWWEAGHGNDEDFWREIAVAIVAVGPASVPHILRDMPTRMGEVKEGMAALGVGCAYGGLLLGLKEGLYPGLIQVLRQDDDAEVRRFAAGYLGMAGSFVRTSHDMSFLADNGLAVTDDVIAALTEALRDEDPAVRRQAAISLNGLGSAAADAVPALKQALNDKDDDVREAAAEALKKIKQAMAQPTDEPEGDAP